MAFEPVQATLAHARTVRQTFFQPELQKRNPARVGFHYESECHACAWQKNYVRRALKTDERFLNFVCFRHEP